MSARQRGRPFEPGRSGNPGGRPRFAGELRELARAHAPEAIQELARLAVKAKSEAARVAAIRELLDRGFGKSTQFVANEHKAIPDDVSAVELRKQLLADFERIFPDYQIVPRLTVIDGTMSACSAAVGLAPTDKAGLALPTSACK